MHCFPVNFTDSCSESMKTNTKSEKLNICSYEFDYSHYIGKKIKVQSDIIKR